MIPKIIHYCWFGRGEMPDSAKRCIASWHEFMPDWEYKLWNEDNFDVNSVPYTQEAYEVKKYAFVSDYARLWALCRSRYTLIPLSDISDIRRSMLLPLI